MSVGGIIAVLVAFVVVAVFYVGWRLEKRDKGRVSALATKEKFTASSHFGKPQRDYVGIDEVGKRLLLKSNTDKPIIVSFAKVRDYQHTWIENNRGSFVWKTNHKVVFSLRDTSNPKYTISMNAEKEADSLMEGLNQAFEGRAA